MVKELDFEPGEDLRIFLNEGLKGYYKIARGAILAKGTGIYMVSN
jgi:hypothetical protein|tara:strand:- start:1180 stop:1314 length:135 start_codon:yes stop_codon:yes gene_type:complete